MQDPQTYDFLSISLDDLSHLEPRCSPLSSSHFLLPSFPPLQSTPSHSSYVLPRRSFLLLTTTPPFAPFPTAAAAAPGIQGASRSVSKETCLSAEGVGIRIGVLQAGTTPCVSFLHREV